MEVSYTVHANSLNDRTRHVDDTHAPFGCDRLLLCPDRRNDAIAVHLKAPELWSVACGLESAHGDPRTLLAPSYDLLVDSPSRLVFTTYFGLRSVKSLTRLPCGELRH
jgi:predicted metalloprotease with PDZ domain